MAVKRHPRIPHFFEIGFGNIERNCEILKKYHIKFSKVILLGDPKTFKIGGTKIARDFIRRGIKVTKRAVTKSNYVLVDKIMNLIKKHQPDLVIGFGGGKVLDVAKLAAGENQVKYISIPTILSNDGIASPVAVITNRKNIPVSHLTAPPYGVIIDLDIIKKAPIRHLRAGVGDLISNLSAVSDARLGQKKDKDNIPPDIMRLAETGPVKLLKCNSDNIKSREFLKCLTDGLIKSGLAMCMVGSSRPASGSEHKISHALDYLYPQRKTLHGEQVGIAALFTMMLQRNRFLKKVIQLYRRTGFPRKIVYLGVNRDEFFHVLTKAKSIRPSRYTVLEDRGISKRQVLETIRKLKL